MRILIVGFGSIGKRHRSVLTKILSECHIDIFDPAAGHNIEPQGRYDWGVICTPSSRHIEDILWVKKLCKKIFVEKPLHTNLADIRNACSELQDYEIHVGCNIRYTKAVSRLNSLKDRVRLVTVTSMSNVLNWRLDPNRSSYSFHKNMGGGVLLDFIHEPDYVYSIFGLPNDAHVIQGRLHENFTVDSEDTCIMSWKYDRTYVNFALSYCSQNYVRKIDVLTDDGILETIHIEKEDIEQSYERQWNDILANGAKNSYSNCLELYTKILEEA